MTAEVRRWVLIILVSALIVALVIWARGPLHRVGLNFGALGEVSQSVPVEWPSILGEDA